MLLRGTSRLVHSVVVSSQIESTGRGHRSEWDLSVATSNRFEPKDVSSSGRLAGDAPTSSREDWPLLREERSSTLMQAKQL